MPKRTKPTPDDSLTTVVNDYLPKFVGLFNTGNWDALYENDFIRPSHCIHFKKAGLVYDGRDQVIAYWKAKFQDDWQISELKLKGDPHKILQTRIIGNRSGATKDIVEAAIVTVALTLKQKDSPSPAVDDPEIEQFWIHWEDCFWSLEGEVYP